MTDINNLPKTLKDEGRFCLWRFEYDKNERLTKVPYNPKTLQRGRSNDLETFTDFETAAKAYRDSPNTFEGIGFKIFGRIGAIDIDHCVDQYGKCSIEASDVMTTIGSYIERSPSGDGVHIFFIIPEGFTYNTADYYITNHDSDIEPRLEYYIPGMTNRFLTITGETITPGSDLKTVPAEDLQAVLDKYMRRPKPKTTNTAPPTPLNISDSELLEKIRTSANADAFETLWRGDFTGYDSQSEADQALCAILAFWTGRDADQIDRLFRQSGLYREDKWNRSSYRDKTIQKAIDACPTVYDPQYRSNTTSQKPHKAPEETKADNLTPETGNAVTGDLEAPEEQNEPVEHIEQSEQNEQVEHNEQDDMPPELKARIEEYGPQIGGFLNSIYTDKYRPIPTGIRGLDEFLDGGLIRQMLVLIGARPAAGKTIFAQMIAESLAKEGIPVYYFCLEMSTDQLYARSLSRIMYTELHWKTTAVKILQGYKHDEAMKENVEKAAKLYAKEINPHIRYNPKNLPDIDQLLQYLTDEGERFKAAGQAAPVVFVDYLHLLQSDRREEQSERIKRAVTGLKEYAVKYNTIVVGIEAQSREANKSDKAIMEGGRDTSNLEYSGDLCLSLVTGDQEDKVNGDPNKVTLYVTKSRFTSFNIDNGLVFVKHGGQSFLEQEGEWTSTPINENETPYDPDKYSGIPVR